MVTLAFIVAPAIFRGVASRGDAGTIFGSILHSFGLVQMVLALLALAAIVVLQVGGDFRPGHGFYRLGILILMLLLVCVSQYSIAPAIEAQRRAIPNFDAVPAGVPARARFDSLHRWSVRLAGLTLILGAGLLVVSAAKLKPPSDGP
jgi:hypothetical protein